MALRSNLKNLSSIRTWLITAGLLGLGGAVSSPGYSPIENTDAADAATELAERFGELARDNLRNQSLTPALLRESAALLQGASRENAGEPRYARLLAHAMQQLGDSAGEIEAWNQYIRLVSAAGGQDQQAQVHIIDLYFSRIQTADAQLSYVKDVMSREAIPAVVRSHAACLGVQILVERSPEQASAMVERAVKLYPTPEAVGYRYELVAKKGTSAERVIGLLAILKANPNQLGAVQQLANEVAEAGMAQESLDWYGAALDIFNRSGMLPSHDFVMQYASELMLAGQGHAAQAIATKLLELDPADPDFWFLKLTLDRGMHQQVAMTQSLELAREMFVRRWAAINASIMGEPAPAAPDPKEGAATAPAISPPDTGPAIQKLAEAANAEHIPAFVAVMNNLAWLSLYYENRPDAAAPWIDAMAAVAGAKDSVVLRLQGWRALESGKTKEARDIFEQIADQDPLAALGLVRLDDAEKLTADADILKQRLLSKYPAGILAAVMREGLVPNLSLTVDEPSTLVPPATAPAAPDGPTTSDSGRAPSADPASDHSRAPRADAPGASTAPPSTGTAGDRLSGLKKASLPGKALSAATLPSVLSSAVAAVPATQPANVDVIRNALQTFPKDWMLVLDRPQSLYALTADPVKAAVQFGEPLLARVSIRNVSNNDLFIGPTGLLQPGLWFDASIRGITQQNFAAVAYDTIAGAVVLAPRESMSQIVRVDQGELSDVLHQRAVGTMLVTGTVTTNPLMTSKGAAPGPAGYLATFSRNFVRLPTDMKSDSARKKIYDSLASGSPATKMQSLEVLGISMQSMTRDADAAARGLADEYLNAIIKARGDSVPEVSAWAGYLAVTLPSVDGQDQILAGLIKSEAWSSRLLALVALKSRAPELQKQFAGPLSENDPEPIVKLFAGAMLDELQHPGARPGSTTGPALDGPALPGNDSGPAIDNSVPK